MTLLLAGIVLLDLPCSAQDLRWHIDLSNGDTIVVASIDSVVDSRIVVTDQSHTFDLSIDSIDAVAQYRRQSFPTNIGMILGGVIGLGIGIGRQDWRTNPLEELFTLAKMKSLFAWAIGGSIAGYLAAYLVEHSGGYNYRVMLKGRSTRARRSLLKEAIL